MPIKDFLDYHKSPWISPVSNFGLVRVEWSDYLVRIDEELREHVNLSQHSYSYEYKRIQDQSID